MSSPPEILKSKSFLSIISQSLCKCFSFHLHIKCIFCNASLSHNFCFSLQICYLQHAAPSRSSSSQQLRLILQHLSSSIVILVFEPTPNAARQTSSSSEHSKCQRQTDSVGAQVLSGAHDRRVIIITFGKP